MESISVYTPLAYLAVLSSALFVFARYYRSKRIVHLTTQKPFFPENLPKQIYFQLKTQDPKPNDQVLKAALLQRGAESIRRTIKLKEVAPQITQLYQRGSIGDELWERFQNASKLEELEIQEIVAETELYKKGWIQKFVPLLQEICFNEALRRRYEAIENRKLDLLENWGIAVSDDGKLTVPNAHILPQLRNVVRPMPATPSPSPQPK